MSRTYRKSRMIAKMSETEYINSRLSIYRSVWTKHRKPADQYKKEFEKATLKAQAEYEAKLKTASYDEFGRPYNGYIRQYNWGWANLGEERYSLVRNYLYLQKPFVNKFYYVEVKLSREEMVEKYRKEYKKYSRDGDCSESGRKSGFKKAAASMTRRNNKSLAKKILRDEECDYPYPDEHDGDYLVWSFW